MSLTNGGCNILSLEETTYSDLCAMLHVHSTMTRRVRSTESLRDHNIAMQVEQRAIQPAYLRQALSFTTRPFTRSNTTCSARYKYKLAANTMSLLIFVIPVNRNERFRSPIVLISTTSTYLLK